MPPGNGRQAKECDSSSDRSEPTAIDSPTDGDITNGPWLHGDPGFRGQNPVLKCFLTVGEALQCMFALEILRFS